MAPLQFIMCRATVTLRSWTAGESARVREMCSAYFLREREKLLNVIWFWVKIYVVIESDAIIFLTFNNSSYCLSS